MAGTPQGLRPRRHRANRAKGASPDKPDVARDDVDDEQQKRKIRDRTAQLKERVNDRRAQLEAQRSTSRRVDAAFRLVERHTEAGGALLAGAIAFRIFLFLVPCVFVVVIGLGAGSDLVGTDPRHVAKSLGMAGLVATAVDASATGSTTTRWVTLAFATLALVLGARNLLRALLLLHALIWRLPLRKPRRLTVDSLVVIGIFLAGTLVLRAVYLARGVSLIGWVVGLVLFTAVPAAIWLACSLVLFPHPPEATWRDMLPGSLLFGVGIELLHVSTVVWFAPYLQSKSETYGTIGAAIAILVWAYIVGRLVTASVTLNVVLWHRTPPSPDAEGNSDDEDASG